MPKVHRFRQFVITRDDYVTSTRMGTKRKIKEIRAEIIPYTELKVSKSVLVDGLTATNFGSTNDKQKRNKARKLKTKSKRRKRPL